MSSNSHPKERASHSGRSGSSSAGPRSPIARHPGTPWYRHPWPWLLFAGPAAVAVAGSVTIWLAITSSDGLVADDYYKRGLAINRVLERDREAARLGIHAIVSQEPQGVLKVVLSGESVLPPALTLQLVHPTRAGDDRTLTLTPTARGVYRSIAAPIPAGRRYVIVGDEAGSWRLTGEWKLPAVRALELAPPGRERGAS